jgi:hypothetical protein
MPLSWSAFWTLFTCSELAPPVMLVPACGVPGVLPAPEDGMLPPLPGAVVPDCPTPAPGFALPVAPEPVPGAGVVVLGWVADGAGVALGVLPPEPFGGALPVPVLCASAGAAIAARIASVARLLMTRDAIVCSSWELLAPS